MRYCVRCILPDTRPGLRIDASGVCSACRNHETRSSIDWAARRRAFTQVVERAKARAKGYDCLVPVSGGKDSTWQVVHCLESGMNPLAVTWKSPARTELGRINLENLISLGVDHIDYQVNPIVERKFMLAAFERFGSTAIPMHMALFSIPLRIALKFEIPLIVWGENSAFEYGGAEEELTGFRLDGAWLEKYGVTHGTRAQDWISERLSPRELTPYFRPSTIELEAAGILAVFLGYYLPWDPATTYSVARAHGFQARVEGPRTGYYDFADIDDDFISIHHHLKWHKFGFTRLHDNLSLEIRNGRLHREEAIEIVRRRGDETPHGDIDKFCRFVGIDRAGFERISERFRNPGIWSRRDGKWVIEEFLIKDWRWT